MLDTHIGPCYRKIEPASEVSEPGILAKVLAIETKWPVEPIQSPLILFRSLGVDCTITKHLSMR